MVFFMLFVGIYLKLVVKYLFGLSRHRKSYFSAEFSAGAYDQMSLLIFPVSHTRTRRYPEQVRVGLHRIHTLIGRKLPSVRHEFMLSFTFDK